MTRRPAQVQVSRRSYTHTVCCLADHNADKIPSVLVIAELPHSGLGEQKVTFSGQCETRHLPKQNKFCSLKLFAFNCIVTQT